MLSITPDQLGAAGSHIARVWGGGYRIEEIESPTHAVALFHVVCSDGGRFTVAVDKWGNMGGPVDSHGCETPDRTKALAALVRDMHEVATAP